MLTVAQGIKSLTWISSLICNHHASAQIFTLLLLCSLDCFSQLGSMPFFTILRRVSVCRTALAICSHIRKLLCRQRLVLCALTASLAGFLLGFDTIVISGAEQRIQQLWGLSSTVHGLCMSAALWGTVVGSIVGAWPCESWGRRSTLLLIGVLYFGSSLASAFSNDAESFMLARFVGGLGVGIATIASPLYITEISPASLRGRLTGLFQLNIVFGMLAALFSNALLSRMLSVDVAWRVMLAIMAVPSLAYLVFSMGIPESPRWLISNGQQAAGRAVFESISPEISDAEIARLVDAIDSALHTESVMSDGAKPRFWRWDLRWPISLAFFIAFFNQLSGINAVLYFAPRIFEWAGLTENAALLQSVGIGVANAVFTLLGLCLIDSIGRRTLLMVGVLGYILSLGGCSLAFAVEAFSLVPSCIFAFVGAHAIGQGTVIWVFISEIFPELERAKGQVLGCSTHWICAAALALVFPKMVEAFTPAKIFAFFCFMTCVHMVWLVTMMPETKGVALEDMQAYLAQGRTAVGGKIGSPSPSPRLVGCSQSCDSQLESR